MNKIETMDYLKKENRKLTKINNFLKKELLTMMLNGNKYCMVFYEKYNDVEIIFICIDTNNYIFTENILNVDKNIVTENSIINIHRTNNDIIILEIYNDGIKMTYTFKFNILNNKLSVVPIETEIYSYSESNDIPWFCTTSNAIKLLVS